MSKSVVRSVKNVTKGYSSVQVKVRNATSNERWGPSGADMADIAEMTHHSQADCYEVVDMLEKRLNDKGKNWRHVLKSLSVLEYCLHEGSEVVVRWAKQHIYIIRTLREFQYIDEDGQDVGSNIRKSAKDLTSFILDDERIRTARLTRKQWKSRVTGLDHSAPPEYAQGPSSPRRQERRPKDDGEDLEFKLALEASKNEMEEDRKRRESQPGRPDDDDDLARAIKLSKEEEELRRKELEQQNAASLFDDTPTPTQQQSQPTGWNQGYQQQGAVDWFGNPMEQQQQQQQQQQQPLSTGFLNNAYSQPFGFQNQQTGFQNGYGFNPYQQQQQQQPQQAAFDQTQYMQPQQTAFNMNNPYGQQSEPAQQEDPAQKPGSQNPWANLESQQSLPPQPTGSNNPFATAVSRPQQPTQSAQKKPTLNTLAEQKTTSQFNSFPTSLPSQQQQPQAQAAPPQQKETDPYASRLNALLATGDGQDTFGNVGDLRIPAQHTAPGTFINSAGSGVNRLQPTQTGTNPFMQSQFTGMPTQGQMPAQTGPANSFGGNFGAFGSSNPFSAGPGQQQQFGAQQQPQQQRQTQNGSLIDF